jgi:hypothetical protein
LWFEVIYDDAADVLERVAGPLGSGAVDAMLRGLSDGYGWRGRDGSLQGRRDRVRPSCVRAVLPDPGRRRLRGLSWWVFAGVLVFEAGWPACAP